MFRFALIGLWAAMAYAQPNEPFKPKPPVEVDTALKARVQEFFDLHVKAQFRRAEDLVAEDTKDFFYTRNKPKYIACELSKIDYSDNFTKANVVVLCEQYIMMPGFTDHPMKVPTPSTWKIENGKWVWWVDQDALRNTPWGRMSPGASPEKAGAPALPPSFPKTIPTTADFVYKQIQLDRTAVSLKVGTKAEVVITNTAPGEMTLSLAPGGPKEIEAKLDKLNLMAGAKATLTLSAAKGAKSGEINLQVVQTLQMIPIQVTIVE